MPAPIILGYRHSQRTALPDRISASEVARVAAELRRQLGYRPDGPLKVDHREIIERVRVIRVNGRPIKVEWGLDAPVSDDSGSPALGSCEFDTSLPDCALVYVNTKEIGFRGYLERSTTIHELGHAIFDSPGWIVAHRQGRLNLDSGGHGTTRVFRFVTTGEEHFCASRTGTGPIDWSEFRANEFMGVFLAPEDSVRNGLYRLCRRMKVPLVDKDSQQQRLPGFAGGCPQADFSGRHASSLEPAIHELARERGLSPSFIRVRLKKYGLVRGLPSDFFVQKFTTSRE